MLKRSCKASPHPTRDFLEPFSSNKPKFRLEPAAVYSQNLHRAHADQGTEGLLDNKKHMKMRKLTTLLNFLRFRRPQSVVKAALK